MTDRRDRLDRFLVALARLKPHLRGFANVDHVDVGMRYVGGKLTRRLAIRVFVRGPKIRGRRTGRRGVRLLPAEIDGVPIDVISTRFVPHGGAAVAAPPGLLAGGASIGTAQEPPGTLGCIVTVERRAGSFALTSSHVVHADADVLAFGQGASGVRVGVVDSIAYDQGAALVRLEVPCDRPGSRRGLSPVLPALTDEALRQGVVAGLPVVKCGAKTGVTRAHLTGLDGDELTISPKRLGEVIALGGDSGAIWTTEAGGAVGLHFAGGERGAFARARPMWGVTSALQVGFGAQG